MTVTQATVGRPLPGSQDHSEVFINGAWRAAAGPDAIDVFDSGTEERLGTVRSASIRDLDDAVEAARRAHARWSATNPAERARILMALHDALEPRTGELTALIAAEVGTAVRLSSAIQVQSALAILAETARLLTEFEFTEQIGNVTVVHQSSGVAAAITPWNYPLFQTVAKVGAALAAGSTVVHKPSGLAPLSSFVLADACAAAGLPPGTYNLVTGSGSDVGSRLAAHPGVDMVSFTGSTEVGIAVYREAARSLKRVALELGGKSASIILDDADLPTAIKTSVNRGLLNSGQTCDAWTRLLVPRSLLDDCVALALEATDRLTLGDPFDERTRLGPLVSGQQVQRVRRYIDHALGDGAVLIAGGSERPVDLEVGYYVRPTLLANISADMAVAREEVFGPVLVVMTYESDDEAVEIANATDYGLSGAVWSPDADRVARIVNGMRAGQVVVNGGRFNPSAPVGGVKMSGIGRELGAAGIAEFLETKSVVH